MPLTDFVVADRADAPRVGETLNPSQELGGIDAKGIDQVKMGTLYAILAGTTYDPQFLISEDSVLYASSDDGPWVQLVPQDLTDRLAAIQDHQVSEFAKAWVATDEFDPRYSNWPLPAVEQLIRDLAALSRRAIAEGKSVLMWTSL